MRRFLFPTTLLVALAWAGPAFADQLGDTETFEVNDNYDASGADTVDATLRALGNTVYFYVDDRHWDGLSTSARSAYLLDLQELVSEWDSKIYPRSVAFWGHKNYPGVDDDPRVTILLEELRPGNGGYYETIHGYSTNQAPDSNEREMFVVAVDSVGENRRALAFIAHEFQHLISFNQRELILESTDDVWLNETRSEYNVTIGGQNDPYSGSSLQSRAFAFQRTPSDSLTEWPNTGTDYAIAALFGQYLADRFGSSLLQSTIHTRKSGVQAIDEWFGNNSRPERFRDAFADWMTAVVINDPADIRYGYRTAGLNSFHLNAQNPKPVNATSGATWNFELKEWQPQWVRADLPSLIGAPALNFRVSGDPIDWGGTYAANYDGVNAYGSWRGIGSVASIPTSSNGRKLRSVTFSIAQGTSKSTQGGSMGDESVSLTATLGELTSAGPTPPPPPPGAPTTGPIRDGDLIRRPGQQEVYVIWGKYRRYLVPGVLELYGFQNRPVIEVPDDVFAQYTTSNYIRQVDTEPVYAVWPDGTKHHFNITAAQWDASGRDWNSIFIVNDREAAFYAAGADITR